MTDLLAVASAQRMIENHRNAAALEGDDETIIWHVIADIIEWCDFKRVDFDENVKDAREHLRNL